MHGIDWDGDIITIKLVTQLNNMSGLLKEGTVIELLNFNSIIFTYGEHQKVR